MPFIHTEHRQIPSDLINLLLTNIDDTMGEWLEQLPVRRWVRGRVESGIGELPVITITPSVLNAEILENTE